MGYYPKDMRTVGVRAAILSLRVDQGDLVSGNHQPPYNWSQFFWPLYYDEVNMKTII